jgi:hypothetical protein
MSNDHNDSNPVDQAGTTPGITSKLQPKKVAIKCRVSGCDSVEAVEVFGSAQSEVGAPSQRVYQCVKCQGTWGLTIGGYFSF